MHDPEFQFVSIDHIIINQTPVREASNSIPDPQLLRSIRELGLLSPITVRFLRPALYEVVDGDRRLRCLQELRASEVPCRVHVGLSDTDAERLRFDLNTLVRTRKSSTAFRPEK